MKKLLNISPIGESFGTNEDIIFTNEVSYLEVDKALYLNRNHLTTKYFICTSNECKKNFFYKNKFHSEKNSFSSSKFIKKYLELY